MELINGKYGRIENIIKSNDMCYVQVSIFKMFDDLPFPGVSHLKRNDDVENSENTIVIPIVEIRCKVIIIYLEHAQYLSNLPNTIEIQ